MYIQLKNTKVQYPTEDRYDHMICSCVVESDLSYERPIMVRNMNQLICWFGTDFPEYDYCSELLNREVSLWITKPTIDNSLERDYYLDYSNWQVEEVENLPSKGNKETIYKTYNSNTKWFWLEEIEDWIEEEYLPQNAENASTISNNNRDSLLVWKSGISFTPTYKISDTISSNEFINLYTDGNHTLTLTMPDSIPDNWNGFIIYDRVRLNLYKGEYKPIDDPKLPPYYDNLTVSSDINDVDDVVNAISSFLLDKISSSDKIISKESCIFLSSEVIKNVRFYRLPGFEFKQDYQINQDYIIKSIRSFKEITIETKKNISIDYNRTTGDLILDGEIQGSQVTNKDKFDSILKEKRPDVSYSGNLWNWILLNKTYEGTIKEHNYYDREIKEIKETLTFDPLVTFISKTIGTGGIDGNISISASEGRLIVERFGYEEVFEPDDIEDNEEFINLNSMLVYTEGNIGDWIKSDRDIRTLRGGYKEINTSYRKSLDLLLSGNEIYPDFVFIESPYGKYHIDGPEDPYWEKLLGYSEKCLGCQFLIQNEEENYTKNYILDKDNLFIFFWEPMNWRGYDRPSWYVWLNGIFSGEYIELVDDVLYESPVKESHNGGVDNNLYEGYNSSLLRNLKKYKSNYLVNNGQKYYYETFFDGESYKTTSLMRFTLSKICRELEKRKWEYLGEKAYGKIEKNFKQILREIRSGYNIIQSILVTNFDLDTKNNKLTVSIDTTISDLIKSNMSLDITINYNKY